MSLVPHRNRLTVLELSCDSVLALVSVLLLDLVVITHHLVELAGKSRMLCDDGGWGGEGEKEKYYRVYNIVSSYYNRPTCELAVSAKGAVTSQEGLVKLVTNFPTSLLH